MFANVPENADSVDLSSYDIIIDAIDTVSAKIELAAEPEFDKVIVNNVVDDAANELWNLIATEFNL